ncbi:Zinc finger protein [Pseudolycoriella hygida]|uniref:Zinc finger protein n=1 Tax=Pseudolycoriella hygida TaxID=35572 RepID=A0A9Q0S0T8_9DIPT|nr:Zinc finger protein [Pseudolycoriella hygida]
MSESEKRDKPKKCKCCNTPISKSFRYIYDEEGKELNIEFLLFDCVGKKVHEKNGLDQAICTKCLLQLQQSYEFKKKCLEAADDSEDSSSEIEICEKSSPKSEIFTNEEYLTEVDDPMFNVMKEELLIEEPFEEHTHKNDEDEVKYVEIIEFIEDVNKDTSPKSQQHVNDKLSTSITLPTVKIKFAKNVPSHPIKFKPEKLANSKAIDVEKIRNSDDLVDILEDDYQSESDSIRKRLTDTADEFKIPKIEVEDFCDNIEYLDESKPIDMDEYIKQVTLISYDEKKNFLSHIQCVMCDNDEVKLKNFRAIVQHMYNEHHDGNIDQFACLISAQCGSYTNLDDLKNHYATDHQDIITPSLKLKCLTCDMIFDSPIKFGKHICQDDYQIKESEKDFKCSLCKKQLTSRKRLLFHKQFHISNQRPKFCLVCQTKYEDENSFYEHVMFSHEQVFEHFCTQCDKSFSTETDLTRHENSHSAQRNYKCSDCGKKFMDSQTLSEHSVVHLPEKPLKCDICDKCYTRKSRLQKHMKSHAVFESSTFIMCEICNAALLDDESAVEHLRVSHNEVNDSDEFLFGCQKFDKVFVCEYCDLAFGTAEAVLMHRECHTDEVKFQCPYCDSKFDTFSKKRTHILIHKSKITTFPVARYFICDQDNCFKSYIHWSSLTAHRKTRHLINPSIIKCPECPETFYCSWKYDYHKKTVHNECESCPICSKGFYKKKSLDIHIQRVHIDDQRKRMNSKGEVAETMIVETNGEISCKECGKICPTRYNAISHISMVHLKVRNFQCSVCDKSFYQKGDLNDHYRLHTKEKPFSCQFCSYTSRKRSMLVTHERAHTNERPFQCPRCPCAFKRSYVLKNHLKYHDGVKEFQCSVETCRKMFTTNAALNFHCKSKHNDTANGNVDIRVTETNTKEETPQAVKRASKRKIPKIVYVLPGKRDSEETRSKIARTETEASIPDSMN